jgi:hypothetical protein
MILFDNNYDDHVDVTPGCVLARLITITFMMAVSACACETTGILI